MKAIGYVALGFVALAAAIALGLLATSLPDLARYIRLRRM
jgi:hypothetical protein